MYSPILVKICSFAAMSSAIGSWFVKKKKLFLVVQSLAIILLAFSNFFNVTFLPVCTYLIAFIRMIVYYSYEKTNKTAPFIIKTIFAVLNVVAYFVLNAISGTLFNPIDLLVMTASVLYAYGFGIRNLQHLRLFFVPPTVMTIIYYAFVPNSIFMLISYSFELCANLVSFAIYRDRKIGFERKKAKNK